MTNVFHHVRNFIEQQPIPAKTLEKSSSPNILYTALPKHWRSNKSFQEPFYVVLLTPVPDNTEVSIWAGNDEKPCEEVRNEKAKVHRQVAKFNDLRFVGRSGRGRKFHLTIVIHSSPMMVATVKNVIKVTVDGPRDARIPKLTGGLKRPSESQPPTIFPPDILSSPAPPIPMPMIPHPWWPLPINPSLPPSFLFSPHSPMSTFWKIHSESMKTPMKIKAGQENVSLNTSSCISSPSIFITPNSNDRKRGSTSPKSIKTSSASINFIQETPESIPSKRRRNMSTTSSNSSSPTIWRPF
uniref:Runt domain-containing protein n=1 Tax=Caenorhabditis tropicalis TaxID=1561998 RepID=A0A1I7UL52_9PELO